MRIVSLTCSNTEIVCALGCGDWLVGVDDHSDFPPDALRGLARVGKDLDVDVAAVAALRPDLVLASLTVPGHERVVAAVAAAGLPHVAPAPTSLADVVRDVRDIAALLGVAQRGAALAGQLEAAFSGPVPSDGPPVLVEWWPKPCIVPGRRSWVTDLLALAGARNPFADRDVESTPITVEEALAAAPEAVVISWCGVPDSHLRPDVVRRRAGWAAVPAVREGRISVVSEALLGRPGPRLVEGLAALRAVVADLPRR